MTLLILLLALLPQRGTQAEVIQPTGYVLVPETPQFKAGGIEVRIVQGFAAQFVYSVKTEADGRFAFPPFQPINPVVHNQSPGAPDTLYFYINLPGYETVMQIVKLGNAQYTGGAIGNLIFLRRGPSDPNVLTTEWNAPPLTRLEALRKEMVEAYNELAVREYEAGLRDSVKHKQDTASEHYRKAIKAAPAFFDAYLQLGFAEKELGHPVEAEKAFRKCVEIRPRSGQALTALGSILLDKGSYDEASSILKEAIARVPWSGDAQYFLGSALFKLGRLDEAESTLKLSVSAEPPNQDARLMLVNVFMRQRRHKEAIEQLDEYLTAVPDSPQRKAVEDLRTQIQTALKAPR